MQKETIFRVRDSSDLNAYCVINTIPESNKTKPQYWRNVLNIEGIIKTGLRAESEPNIITANKPIGKKKTPKLSSDRKTLSVLYVKAK